MTTSPPTPAPRKGPPALTVRVDVPETFGYRLKKRLLGPPMVTARLSEERLSNPVALGVLSPDCISSSAYGTEEMLIVLLPAIGLAAFNLVLPITGAILVILVLMTLSYRQVVQVYTRAGGSYVVARENFGPNVAQIAAVALLIDYVVTVAVQSAAGTVAVVSAVPVLGPYHLAITVGVVLIIFYGNMRGIREAGRAFALPTYLFVVAMGAVIIVGIIRELAGNLPTINPYALHGTVGIGSATSGILMGASLLIVLRSFANGGASLTGLEAISNGVSAFRPPEGQNAKKVLAIMATILGFLVLGVSWLAHVTHATPFQSGYPSVISQEAKLVFGTSGFGHALYIVVQATTALILYTGANTSFNGFPFLASFVAGDSFLPRQLTKRGHRLVFSNGIIVLAVVSIALLIATDAKVDALVPFYAIGVFTGFTMAGLGMAKYHSRVREEHWRPKFFVNLSGGLLSALVVCIFVITKFKEPHRWEGAWLVVLLFPILTYALIRLNRRYRREADVLEAVGDKMRNLATFRRHFMFVFVDALDLATLRALRYGQSLRPTDIRAVHFALDDEVARRLAEEWRRVETGVRLEVIECPDRRLVRGALELVSRTITDESTEVTVLLPRRIYGPGGYFLHGRSADMLAAELSKVPHVFAHVVPFDVTTPMDVRPPLKHVELEPPGGEPEEMPPSDVTPIAELQSQRRARIEGRVHSVQIAPRSGVPTLECVVFDGTGGLSVLFFGRRQVPGIEPGAQLRLEGVVGEVDGHLAMANPAYELLPSH
jgi:amino acid transporter